MKIKVVLQCIQNYSSAIIHSRDNTIPHIFRVLDYGGEDLAYNVVPLILSSLLFLRTGIRCVFFVSSISNFNITKFL